MSFDAAILDLDGVLVHSEPLAREAWNQFLSEYGGRLEDEAYASLIGREERESAELVKSWFGVDLDLEELLDRTWMRKTEVIRERAVAAPGAEPLIGELRDRGMRLGLASNSRRTYVDAALAAMGLEAVFGAVVGGDEVERGKPAPDLYLRAAGLLRVEPGRCLAVEDSPAGLESARRAGMRCVVIPNAALEGEPFLGAYARFGSLEGLRAELDSVLT